MISTIIRSEYMEENSTFKTITTILGVVIGAILLGIMAFVLNYIPNVGSIIAAVPAVLLA